MEEPGGDAAGSEAVIFVVSDALGETAELVARAAVSQFDSGRFHVRRFPHVVDEHHLDEVFRLLRDHPRVLLLYTVIVPEVRDSLRRRAQALGIMAVDVLGPVVDALEPILNRPPARRPGLSHRLDEAYFRRVEAVEFAVKYDDGKDLRGLESADIILLGVSRTSKTPVSMYLAHRSLKVANVPLLPEVPMAPEVLRAPRNKLVGLVIQAEVLQQIRARRLELIGLGPNARYADVGRIREELAHARQVFAALGCPVVDVTGLAVEETAERVLAFLEGGVPPG